AAPSDFGSGSVIALRSACRALAWEALSAPAGELLTDFANLVASYLGTLVALSDFDFSAPGPGRMGDSVSVFVSEGWVFSEAFFFRPLFASFSCKYSKRS